MAKIQLKEICSFSKGCQINGDELLENGEYDYLNGGINPSGKWNEYNVSGNTVTISEGGNSSGYVNYMPNPFWCGAHCYYLYELKCDVKYLYYALKSQQDKIMKLRSGACMPNIKKSDIGKFEFEYSSDTNVQKQIAANLDKVTHTIDLCNAILEKLDLLVKSRFVEMFGDFENLINKWHLYRFSDVTINLDNTRKPIKDADRQKIQGIYPYYGATGIVDYLNDYRIEGEYLLISEDGKALEFRNKDIAFIAKGKIWVNNHAHVLQCKENMNMVFLMFYMNNRDISSWVTGIDQKKLNRDNLDKMPVGVPPLALQERFAAFVEQTDKSKFIAKKIAESVRSVKIL